MNTFKKVFYILIVIIIFALVGSLVYFKLQNNKLENQLDVAITNEKAFIEENNKLTSQNIAFKFSLEQLEYFNDSLLNEMNKVRKQLKIKDNEIEQMNYLLLESRRKDTLYIRDTIFRDKNFKLDTLLGDEWYKLKLGLQFPNMIAVEPSFTNELDVFAYSRKETIDPPKKCALARLFQKKHRVIRVEVVNNNPYSIIKKQKFVIIDKK